MSKKIKHTFLAPIAKFVKVESLGGVLLFVATIAAVIWANSPFASFYESLWELKIGFGFGSFQLSKPLILWINDGLMAIFFFLIGLEIKREIILGELNSLKKASLPILAAVGGVIVPILLFFILNKSEDTTGGWGIAMATDIAFSLAILQLLGNRTPLSLKIFLTAFAIVDDLLAVLAIAVFYSEHINWILVIFALLIFTLLLILSLKGIYNQYLSLLCAIMVWFLFLKSGIHPTIAGVMIALTIPIRKKARLTDSLGELEDITKKLENTSAVNRHILSKRQIYLIDDIQDWVNQVQSPLQQLEHGLHGWVAYCIIPIFAFANAGISFGSIETANLDLSINIAVALILGKFLGVFLFTFIGVKLRWAALPKDLNFKHITGVSLLAGVGFTMAIFIANLAFEAQPAFIEASKLGIIAGSVLAGISGYLFLRFSSTNT